MHNIQRLVVAGLLSGGVAAMAFGGSAVSTAFSSDSSGAMGVHAAHVAGALQGGTFNVSGLEPGGPASPSQTITIKNTGNTTEAVWVTIDSISKTAGTDGNNPDLSKLNMVTSHGTVALGGLSSATGYHFHLENLSAGKTDNATVGFSLAQDAGNNWNNASVKIAYTVHFQDISGTDKSSFASGS